MKRVSCYIDGFNLYHSIDALGHAFNYLKWLDLWSLSSAFIMPTKDVLTDVYYFTALAYWRKDAAERHKSFIMANQHHGVSPVLGHFKKKTEKCHQCGSIWETHEEKQSDVNIAAYLIHHAHLDKFDKAFILSADSDLCHAIQLVIDYYPKKEICILIPPNRYEITRELRGKFHAYKIKTSHLKNNLLPYCITSPDGRLISSIPNKYK